MIYYKFSNEDMHYILVKINKIEDRISDMLHLDERSGIVSDIRHVIECLIDGQIIE